jgi:hypothetical protein
VKKKKNKKKIKELRAQCPTQLSLDRASGSVADQSNDSIKIHPDFEPLRPVLQNFNGNDLMNLTKKELERQIDRLIGLGLNMPLLEWVFSTFSRNSKWDRYGYTASGSWWAFIKSREFARTLWLCCSERESINPLYTCTIKDGNEGTNKGMYRFSNTQKGRTSQVRHSRELYKAIRIRPHRHLQDPIGCRWH